MPRAEGYGRCDVLFPSHKRTSTRPAVAGSAALVNARIVHQFEYVGACVIEH